MAEQSQPAESGAELKELSMLTGLDHLRKSAALAWIQLFISLKMPHIICLSR